MQFLKEMRNSVQALALLTSLRAGGAQETLR